MTPHPPCDHIKSYCVASGRKRPSSVRRNLGPAHAPEWMLDQAPAEAKRLNNAEKSRPSMVSCIGSPPIQAAKKKLRAFSDCTASQPASARTSPILGARAGTPDAIALCRGDLKGADIWDYFHPMLTEAPLKPTRPSSASRSLSSPYKSICVAGGRRRMSSVVRQLCPCNVPNVDNFSDGDGSRASSPEAWSPLAGARYNHPGQITVVDHDVHLPVLVQKEVIAESSTTKLMLPKDLADTPRSRRPSMDSVSTAASESDNLRAESTL